LCRHGTARHPGGVFHLGNRRDSRDRFLRERPDGIRHRADQPAVDVDGAAAHALRHTGLGERPPFELRQDQIASGTLNVAEDAEDVDLELFELGALKDRAADADHARTDFVDGHQG
jgi:hypothetical protein